MAALPFADRLVLPLIAAPMLRVSGPLLVAAACEAGVIGAFPTANCRSHAELDDWLGQLALAAARARDAGRMPAPYCPNLIMRRDPQTLRADIACILRHRTELVITSVGSPAAVVPVLHDAGCLVFADVATLQHAEKAIAAGVDGLVLLVAGAGGKTGWANPFAFARAVRGMFAGTLVLAGGLSDGHALRAAQVLGCELGYMGTRFIATRESMAAEAYKQMLVDSTLDDVTLTRHFTGMPTSFLAPSLRAAGLDPDTLDEQVTAEEARRRFSAGGDSPQRWTALWSAGHSVSGVSRVCSVAELVAELKRDYDAALSR